MAPLLSIVIANYNYGRFLDEAIQSVLGQDSGDEIELIICDAASTDNSVEIIKKYAAGLPPNTARSEWNPVTSDRQLTDGNQSQITWWCSEKDGGQSAAFNKGFSHASGKFLTWLNADDVLLPGVIKRLDFASRIHPDCEWFSGGCLWLDPDMHVIRMVHARQFSMLRYESGMVSAWGPSSFFSATMLKKVGGIDERFHYMMDSDLWLRFAIAGYRYKPLRGYAFGLRLHPEAKMSGHNFADSAQNNPNHPKWGQIEKEAEWMRSRKQSKPYGFLRRLLTIDFIATFKDWYDLKKMKGMKYCEV